MDAGPLAHANAFDRIGNERQNPRPDQGVIKDDVGGADQAFGLSGDQVGIARPGPDQPDLAPDGPASLDRGSTGKGGVRRIFAGHGRSLS